MCSWIVKILQIHNRTDSDIKDLYGSQCWMNVRRLGKEKKKNIKNKVNVLKRKRVKSLKRQSTEVQIVID